MRPILLDLPLPGGLHFPVGAYGTFLVIGMLAAAWVSGRHGRRLGLRRLDAFDLGLWLLAAGVAGAHLLYLAADPWSYFADGEAGGGWAASLGRGGMAYYGGLAAAFPVLWLWGRRRRIPYLDLLDFVAPLGALGLAVTRVGCFFNGCCYGEPSGLPWAVAFPIGSQPQQAQAALGLIAPEAPSLPVHPVQLYETAAALAMFGWLWWRFPRRRSAGEAVARVWSALRSLAVRGRIAARRRRRLAAGSERADLQPGAEPGRDRPRRRRLVGGPPSRAATVEPRGAGSRRAARARAGPAGVTRSRNTMYSPSTIGTNAAVSNLPSETTSGVSRGSICVGCRSRLGARRSSARRSPSSSSSPSSARSRPARRG